MNASLIVILLETKLRQKFADCYVKLHFCVTILFLAALEGVCFRKSCEVGIVFEPCCKQLSIYHLGFDIIHRAAVDGKQKRPEHRPLRNADLELHD